MGSENCEDNYQTQAKLQWQKEIMLDGWMVGQDGVGTMLRVRKGVMAWRHGQLGTMQFRDQWGIEIWNNSEHHMCAGFLLQCGDGCGAHKELSKT